MKPSHENLLTTDTSTRSKRILAWACALILLFSTLPLYLISMYNHPYNEDYRFSTGVHAVWQAEHSIKKVLETAVSSAQKTRSSLQGTYTSTFLSSLQPGAFSEELYYLTTFFLLSVFLLCFGFFLKVVFRDLLRLTRHEAIILISLTLFLLIQFMPNTGAAFFWFAGGVSNTFIYSLLALSLGLCGKLLLCKGRIKQTALTLTLLLLMILLGGGSYGGGLLGLLIYALLALWAFVRKNPKGWLFLAFLGVFLTCFLYSFSAPSNDIRVVSLAYRPSAIKSILEALYYGVAVASGYIRLPLLAITALFIPFFVKAAKSSAYRFAHPWLIMLAGACLYCAQLTPTLHADVFIGDGRSINTYYQSFVLLWLLYAFYLTGFVVRKLEKKLPSAQPSPHALRTLVICVSACVLVGCMGYQPTQGSLYGIQNMAGASATLSLLRGEAARYDRDMQRRETVLRDPMQRDVTLAPLSVVPAVFMEDLLTHEATYDVKPLLCEYYQKNSIALPPIERRLACEEGISEE